MRVGRKGEGGLLGDRFGFVKRIYDDDWGMILRVNSRLLIYVQIYAGVRMVCLSNRSLPLMRASDPKMWLSLYQESPTVAST